MHTLLFLDPGHFHAALTIRERHPAVHDEIFVYAPDGPELEAFLGLVEGFNRRSERPTRWRPVVRAGAEPLERLLAERRGDVAILAGKNDRKMAAVRRLHEAGLHVLADKPWIVGPEGLDDVRRSLAGGPLAMEILTGHHAAASILETKLVSTPEVFGDFRADHGGAAAIEIASVHHLDKRVDGAPLRRPAWFFDVRVQGDGLADIPTHLVDHVQRLLAGYGDHPDQREIELEAARCWPTLVPREIFRRITGLDEVPTELREHAGGDPLAYYGNGELRLRLGGVRARLTTRWDLSAPEGGGDTYESALRGTRADVRVEQTARTGFRRRLLVEPRPGESRVGEALERAVAGWQAACPGLAVRRRDGAFEIAIPEALSTAHESHFPLVLDAFLRLVDDGSRPAAVAADTLARYTLLARASALARRDR